GDLCPYSIIVYDSESQGSSNSSSAEGRRDLYERGVISASGCHRMRLLRDCDRGRPLSTLRIHDPQFIIHGLYQVLLHAEVFLSGLNRGMTQQHLDLLEVAA